MMDFKTELQKHIDAEVGRRVDQRLAEIFAELGIKAPRDLRATPDGSAKTRPRVKTGARKRTRVVSDATRAKMRESWARRKAAASETSGRSQAQAAQTAADGS